MSVPVLVSPKRCAVYCRVSSDERLDQSFNSIDAQKEAGHAFIKSQSHEGWIAVGDDYDDPGFSGGNVDRPALKRLMADIEAGRIDIVVVYKIDRLSRSLADFARMVEVFDRCRVSFSAVTQQINSATSMGRLMLNVLLSFAQFEREVTGERIRDKIAASKAKGMWMGGRVPLGYDLQDRLLVMNDREASLVRRIFDDFVTMRSATLMVRTYAAEGLVTKDGNAFTKQTLGKMLHNRIYLGEIVHKGKSFPGQHEAIVTQAQWDAAHALIASDVRERTRATMDREREPILLRGLLYASDGERLVPTYTLKKGKKYRYYAPVRQRRLGAWASRHGSLPAGPIEELVIEQIVGALSAPRVVQVVWDHVRATQPNLSEPEVVLPMRRLATVWQQLFPVEQCRLAQLLIERVVIADAGLEIVWRDAGWAELAGELMPGTIGAELQEWESTV
ncbi:recombinase family protein [Ralstonia pseudosolanacearum]|uniref:Putative site-specific integrase protein n=1 Tax=Ralstonia solanacearum TaxID=305 RepID=A0A0S4X1T7_RALSL|nr:MULTISPECIES: recombinase family protein [Ralstonia]UZF15222.1 recombinase family protein [Ralstonia solanacearum]UZF30298.1 recombinase family protein [Ralstonia sp. RS650]CUV57890.1 putative site-specific integrase protein [Ralstonia solanacearum]